MGNQHVSHSHSHSYSHPHSELVKLKLSVPWLEIILFLEIKDVQNVRLASLEGERAATESLKLKHMNCSSMSLSISRGPVTNDRLKFLVNKGILKYQKHLVINECRLTADGFAHLKGLEIEAIVLLNVTSINNHCVDNMAQMKSLDSVSIKIDSDTEQTDMSIAYATKVMSHLKTLSVNFFNRPVRIGDIVHLGGMHAIKSLTFWPCTPGICLKYIALTLGERLDSLDIQFSPGFSDDDVRAIASMKSLRSLKLSSVDAIFDDSHNFSPLITLVNLETLQIKYPVTEQFLIDVGRTMHSLHHLVLGDCIHIPDEGLQYLGALHALKTLKICESLLSGTGLAHLYHMSSLETLSLVSCNRLFNKDIRDFVRIVPSLKHVYIYDCAYIWSTIHEGLLCPGVIIRVDDEFSDEQLKKWGH